MMEHIYFYYCNDLHSHFEQWPQIVHYFKQKKHQHQRLNQESWFIDIGDHVDRSHPIAEAYKGKANVELLNEAGFDFATLGNNEGITLEYNDLYHLYDQADFQVTCANLQSIEGKQPTWLKNSIAFTTNENTRVKILGLTAPFNPFYNPLGWQVESPFDYLSREINKLKEDTDILILLSHLGYSEDQLIAEKFPQIDIIIGGHTHHLLKNGEVVNQTLLTAAGKHGKYVGEIHIGWDRTSAEIVDKQAYAVETEHMKQDKDTIQLLEKKSEQAEEQLNQPVTYLHQRLEVDWYKRTPIIQLLTDELKKWTKADISMLNAGLLLESMEPGYITYGDVHRICPHPINPCTVQLRGIEILEVVRGAYNQRLVELELMGFGFRGKILGAFVFSGTEIQTTQDEEGVEHVQKVLLNNKELEHERVYTFATADMFTFGKMFPEIARSKTKQFYLPEFLRDLLKETLQNRL
ncbi:bifunctional metallophosphatase/5'-nucleotidase [Gracilibacillus caseinilyticus]|uniref:Bifunctional metallophosphatase/5'-nucleotidase n=1 Tax=Gracilibacillus caseinilyticus TaxID=2932256 RepID=A0ABY4EWC5_9BACI|nr:bifunctional UDP-sugar hydrolase/5'-nucleotidase [Gracilibacillus caseinilyticus]UOQ48168.1 bifunctional metallophosphatase/5'-nucleotidase [Gracilibacillus caseinilyticus]